jgi:hypothetical protein
MLFLLYFLYALELGICFILLLSGMLFIGSRPDAASRR